MTTTSENSTDQQQVAERQQAEEELRYLAQENAALAEIGRIIGSSLKIGEVFDQFAAEVKRLVPFDRMAIHITNPAAGTYTAKYLSGLSQPGRYVGQVRPLAGTQTQYVVATGEKLVRGDIVDNRFPSDAGYLALGLRSSIILPLVSKGRAIGTLTLCSRQIDAYGTGEVALLERLASQIAPAVANAQLYEERLRAEEAARLRSQELESLFNIAAILARAGSFKEKVARVLAELAGIAQADLATLRVPDEEKQSMYLVAAAGPAGWERPPVLSFQRGLTSVAFQQGETVVANDYAVHPRADPSAVTQGTKSSVFLPIKASGHTFGVIDVLSKEVDHFIPERVRLLTAIVDGVGVLLENARLNAEAQQLAQENAALAEIGRIIGSSLHIDQVYENFATEMKRLVHFDRAVIQVIEPGADTYPLTFMSGVPFHRNRVGDSLPLAGSQLQHILATCRTLVRKDFLGDLGFARDEDMLMVGLRSSIGIPLVSKGKVFGALILASRHVGAYGPRERSILERLANQIAPAVANAQLHGQRLRAERALAEQAVALARVEELERSRQRIIEAQEGVRREIAAHLHGRVQARLLILRSHLQDLLGKDRLSPETTQVLTDIVAETDQIMGQELSVLGHRLYPSILRLGIVPAIQSLCDQFESTQAIELDVNEELTRGERANRGLVPERVRLSMYRIAEEALTNVVKHARASRVIVRLDTLPEQQLRLTVRDEGQGFDTARAARGLGMVAMHDYATVMGGACVVHSTPGQGTEVTAILPLVAPVAAHPVREPP